MPFRRAAAFLALTLAAAPAAAQDAAPAGPQALAETYGAWTVRCRTQPGDTPRRDCEVTQELRHRQTSQLVVSMAFRRQPGGEGGQAVLVAPFGLRLAEGARFLSDDTEIWAGSFQTCLPAGCLSRPELSAAQIAAVLAAKAPRLHFVTDEGEALDIPLQPDGLPDAWRRLGELAGG